jgi:predicted RNA methylase
MEIIAKDVPQLPAELRSVVETWFGRPLRDDQQIVLQIVDSPEQRFDVVLANPPWGNVYEGMSDEEIEQAHGAIVRSRPVPVVRP